MPKISVIIPTYNREKYLPEALDSVLSQVYQDFEIIIVDDGSTDNTKDLVSEYLEKSPDKIRYFYQENKGEPGARNKGINEARGEYIAFIDSDDIWLKDKLEKQIKQIENSNFDLVYSRMHFLKNGKIVTEKQKPAYPALNFEDLLLRRKSIATPTVLLKKNCFADVGLFDETIKLACDYDMWLRLSLRYKIGFLDEPLALYRSHNDNLSLSVEKTKICGIKIFTKLLKTETSVSKKNMRIRLSREYYELGKIYYDTKRYKIAAKNILRSVIVYPSIGFTFISPKGQFREKIIKLFKPYFILIFIFFASFLKGNNKHI